MVPLALESCTLWGKMLKIVIIPSVWAQTQKAGYSIVRTLPSLYYPSLHSLSAVAQCKNYQPPSPSPSVPRLCSFPKHRDTDISQVTRTCMASVQIHINGRREKKLCSTFWDDPPQRKIRAVMFLPLDMLSLKVGRSSNLQLCFSPIH